MLIGMTIGAVRAVKLPTTAFSAHFALVRRAILLSREILSRYKDREGIHRLACRLSAVLNAQLIVAVVILVITPLGHVQLKRLDSSRSTLRCRLIRILRRPCLWSTCSQGACSSQSRKGQEFFSRKGHNFPSNSLFSGGSNDR